VAEVLLRKPAVLRQIPTGRSKFEADIAPRLTKVRLGPRAVAFTQSSVDRLIGELIAESAAAAPIVPAANRARLSKENSAKKENGPAESTEP
jgi:predicted DNA-binding transcriptional regulator AlpA